LSFGESVFLNHISPSRLGGIWEMKKQKEEELNILLNMWDRVGSLVGQENATDRPQETLVPPLPRRQLRWLLCHLEWGS
jgi:hypothetical protein